MRFSITVTDSRYVRAGSPITLRYSEGGRTMQNYRVHRMDADEFLHVVDKAASEVVSIGRERGYPADAHKMAAGLHEKKRCGDRAVLEYCANI